MANDGITPLVSFCDDGSDRARRFTISAQPSSANIATIPALERQGSIQKTSRNNSINDNDVMLFIAKGSHPRNTPLKLNHDYITSSNESSRGNSRVASPVSPGHGRQHQYFDKSPSPPNGKSEKERDGIERGSGARVPSVEIPSRKGSVKKSNKTIVASPIGPPVPFQEYLSKEDDGKIHILLACTGSVATIKVPLILDRLFQIFGKSKISIQLVVTKAATHFLKGLKIRNDVKIWRDEDEWANYDVATTTTTTTSSQTKKTKNPFEKMILHNELRRWADIMLIAPLSANTLAKITHGIADNLVTSIVRSWGSLNSSSTTPKKPILVAPAMNTFMYTHPVTAKQLQMISSAEYGFGIEILKPVEKVLACGDIGMGGMREWVDIVETLRQRIGAISNFNEKQKEGEEGEDEDDEDDGDDDDDDDDGDDDDDDDDEEEDEDDKDAKKDPSLIFDISST